MDKCYLLGLVLLWGMVSCGEKADSERSESSLKIPELVIRDSLVVDHLTSLALLDVMPGRTEYLFFDDKSNEFLRVDSSGEILVKVDRSGDGKDNYQSTYFMGANYLENGDILLQTQNAEFIYDQDFVLKEKRKLDYILVTQNFLGTGAMLTQGNYLYTFSVPEDKAQKIYQSETFSTAFPYLRVYDQRSHQLIAEDSVPASSQPFKRPGAYGRLEPIPQITRDKIYLLFPTSPELYVYDFPGLKPLEVIDLNPDPTYRQILPVKRDGFSLFFADLASSSYEGFAFTNGYLMTWYTGAAPQDEVDQLPRNVVGDSRYQALQEKYKVNYYQIFKGSEKVWEGKWDLKLRSVRGLIYSSYKPGEEPDSVEKDFQTFYFYGLK